MSPLRPALVAAALGGLSLLLWLSPGLPQARAQAPAPTAGIFKDLKVLPKDITKPELKSIMKLQSKALGVDCDHCHKEPNMEADTPKKIIARDMMRMTAELNKNYRASTNGKVTCWSCHRGELRPAEAAK